MHRIRFGLIAGLIFGILDILPMFLMTFPDRTMAITGAFLSRFAIGLLIPAVQWPWPGWLRGLTVGVLVSLPDAVITGTYVPILVTGSVGGVLIGLLVSRAEHRYRVSMGS